MQLNNITFKQVSKKELLAYVKKVKSAFAPALKKSFGESVYIPSDNEFLESCRLDGAETFFIYLDNKEIGGATIIVRPTNINSLELFYILPLHENKGLGTLVWKAIEKRYPKTIIWRTITPYFEERNINFYINKCGFKIIEFFNQWHKENNLQQSDEAITIDKGKEKYFLFEKIMKNEQ